MKKFRNLPAIITLLAGFIISVVMIIKKYPLNEFLWILVAVMAGFFLAGMLISLILNKTVGKEDEELSENPDELEEEIQDDAETERNHEENVESK